MLPLLSLGVGSANKHKPWIEAEYQGIVMENDNTVLLNPPLFALDKDAPLRYAGKWGWGRAGWVGQREVGRRAGAREEGGGPGRESSTWAKWKTEAPGGNPTMVKSSGTVK